MIYIFILKFKYILVCRWQVLILYKQKQEVIELKKMIIVAAILCRVVLAGCSKASFEKSLTETEGVRDNGQVVSAETPLVRY